MRIIVRVHAHSSADKVIANDDGSLRVYVRAVPEHGKANEAVRALLAKHFNCPPSNVTLVLGKTSKEKLFDIS